MKEIVRLMRPWTKMKKIREILRLKQRITNLILTNDQFR
jgi:hypothetical protein